ncbi:MAG: CDP-diacylglycerol--serine O-phosphatidyltransferase [Gammaproteobacteria bacterium]|nr:MAG: CDP-diacylglycerol--serine O-phosphatidyltransferase [Gammaproteobacteria bacterium]
MNEKPIKSRRRGIYLLPNLFTTAGLFAGFYAIVQAMNDNFIHAAIAIFIALLMDGMDGRIARWTHTESDFGAEYDSLADMVSFGLAPALVIYSWALSDLGKLGSLTAFLFAVCAALRLARFNTQHGVTDKRFFRGLPSPAAAVFVGSLVWVLQSYMNQGVVFDTALLDAVAIIATLLAGGLMVSNIHYHSFKELNLKGRVSFVSILGVPLVIVLIMLNPPLVLFLMLLVYVLSGPSELLVRWFRDTPGKDARNNSKNL